METCGGGGLTVVGPKDGEFDGLALGTPENVDVGEIDGSKDGFFVRSKDGEFDGLALGTPENVDVGESDGFRVGELVTGLPVEGARVGEM
jgi:hypothetical protein